MPPCTPTTVTLTSEGVVKLVDRNHVVSLITTEALADLLHNEHTRAQARLVELPRITRREAQ